MNAVQLLCGNGLLLRLPEKADVPAFYELIKTNLDHLSAWRTWTDDMLTLNRVQQFVERNRRAYEEVLSPDFVRGGHPGFSFVLEFQGKLIGMAGFQGLNRTNDIAALGYWIDKQHSGKGFTTRACDKIVEYAFDVLDINRVEIQALTSNTASFKVAEKLGFVREAVLAQVEKSGDRYFDHFLYRKLKEERSLG